MEVVFDDKACILVVEDEVGKIDDGPKTMNAYAEKMMTKMLKEASVVMVVALVLAVFVVMVIFQN